MMKTLIKMILVGLILCGCDSNRQVVSTPSDLGSETPASYDEWTGWVGCYDDLSGEMMRTVQPMQHKLRIKHIQNRGKLFVELQDTSGKTILPRQEISQLNQEIQDLSKVVIRLTAENFAGCFDFSGSDVSAEALSSLKLLGEIHSNALMLNQEFELWKSAYDNHGARDLLIEFPYYYVAYMNEWMKSDNDVILDSLFDDIKGTPGGTETTKSHFRRIKSECPETVFHGTDVGHAYQSTGMRYLNELKDKGMTKTEAYRRTLENIQEGKIFYDSKYAEKYRDIYRENEMTNLFILAFDQLNRPGLVGFYGNVPLLSHKNVTI